MGLAGVHALRNMGHWLGLIFPMTTRWHSHPSRMSLPCFMWMLNFSRASNFDNSGRSCSADSGSLPIPRQLPAVTLNAFFMRCWAFGFPSGLTTREYSFSRRGVFSFICFRIM